LVHKSVLLLCKQKSKDLHIKSKIINDPVYGFINIPGGLIYNLIEHPYFQRLRRIKQLGLTHLVYPGALHTRFQHSLGTMHLMQEAITILKSKGHNISREETEGALVAILLHDIGHGPFSHTLEHSIIRGIHHEELSGIFLKQLNLIFNESLETGIGIYNHHHHKNYLSQLVASQLDVDRLDYLTRDSFFTGVSEGVIGTQRIIKMLDVADGDLVVESKGIHSVEKFIIARQIMYWQVYLHKTVLSAENMLIRILERAKYLARREEDLFSTPALSYFLNNTFTKQELTENEEIIRQFALLDDFDIFTSVKMWSTHSDKVLSVLSKSLVNRRLFRCEIQTEPFDYFYIERLREKMMKKYDLTEEEAHYFLISDTTSNYAYKMDSDKIKILLKSGKISDLLEASGQLNITALPKPVTRHFLCFPKDIV
jgi:uncharacterized protein